MITRRHEVEESVARMYSEYWPPADYAAEIARQAFNAGLIADRLNDGDLVVDIGGGWGVFAAACQTVGLRAVYIDDALDGGFFDGDDKRHDMAKAAGAVFFRRDPLRDGLGLEPNSVQAITSFDAIEHFHQSPKAMLHEAVTALVPGGWLIVATPNAANLRKRISAVLGRTTWSLMGEWYEQPVFRSHVREPIVSDLRYIARDLGLVEVRILGRNFAGQARTGIVGTLASMMDAPLQAMPGLCSDIYLVGRKRL